MPASDDAATQVSTSSGDNRVAAWAPDGQSLLWIDTRSADSVIWVARRKPDRSWDRPFRVSTPRTSNRAASWTPDGRIAFVSDSGLQIIDARTGARPLVIPGFVSAWYAWREDGKSVVGVEGDSLGRVLVTEYALGGKRKVLCYADRLTEQQHRYGFALHGGRVYIPIVDRKADVWVADIESRRPGGP